MDTRQLYTLLLSGRLSDILDDEIRNSLYPLVALPVSSLFINIYLIDFERSSLSY